MGDADNSQFAFATDDLEPWIEEILEEVDISLDNLFSFVNNVNENTKRVLDRVKVVENLQHCFYAMNLFIVPVILAVTLCFGTKEFIDSSGLESGLEIMVKFMMYISGSIGLPLYIYTLWESLRFSMKQEVESCYSSDTEGFMDEDDNEEEDYTKFNDSSSRPADFTRRISSRIHEGMRMDLERRVPQRSSEMEEKEHQTTKTVNRNDAFEEAMPSATEVESSGMGSFQNESWQNIESEIFPELKQFIREPVSRVNSDCNGVRVFIINSNPDLSIKIKPNQKDSSEQMASEGKEGFQVPLLQSERSDPVGERKFQEETFNQLESKEDLENNDLASSSIDVQNSVFSSNI
ncbi:uncharacterized protein LOC118191379 [Stegodyphus dumicola]|uniref:uncharacterized protein LOC118191379 n=1 Tax=Stegodyphus dumicola TaxID=202533 RepID=UPI0015B02E2E|nr:uncharacterized protein LOC118191379 [Stegodyphus dumicola]